jgi:hypothetical protein
MRINYEETMKERADKEKMQQARGGEAELKKEVITTIERLTELQANTKNLNTIEGLQHAIDALNRLEV